MKLVYITHGWHLAIKDDDLFQERIEAWKFGPVIPDLYHATKSFGRDPIPFDLVNDESNVLSCETRAFIKSVFDKYGHLSGFSLSQLTHQSGTPWDRVYKDSVMHIEIPDSLIKEHYREKLNESGRRNPSAA